MLLFILENIGWVALGLLAIISLLVSGVCIYVIGDSILHDRELLHNRPDQGLQ